MSETMAHNIGHALAALPGTLGYHVDDGCVVTTLVQIDPDSDADVQARKQAQASGQRAEMAPGATAPDGTFEAVLAGLPPYWLPLEEIDADQAGYETVLNARLDGLRLLADMGFDVADELTPADDQEDSAEHYKMVNRDSELFNSLRYMIVLIDPNEYAKAHENDGHLYRIYDRFTQERSAITPVSPAIIVVAEELETGAGYYALNRLNDMDLFSGTVADVAEHPQTHAYEQLHNQPVPDNQVEAQALYCVDDTSNTTAITAQPLTGHIADYVAVERDRVVDATVSQFFLDKEEPSDDEIAVADQAVHAAYRRCVHHLTSLVESARSLIVLNGHGAYLDGTDLRVMLEKVAYMLSYSEDDSLFNMFHEVIEIPLLLGDTVDDHTPESVLRLIGGDEVARIIRITLETLVALDLSDSALDSSVAHTIRANALRSLICDAAARRDYNQYRLLADALDRHMGTEDEAERTSAHAVRDSCITPGRMVPLADTSRGLVGYIAFQLGMFTAQHPESTDGLNITDDIVTEVAEAVAANAAD